MVPLSIVQVCVGQNIIVQIGVGNIIVHDYVGLIIVQVYIAQGKLTFCPVFTKELQSPPFLRLLDYENFVLYVRFSSENHKILLSTSQILKANILKGTTLIAHAHFFQERHFSHRRQYSTSLSR